MVYRFYDGDGVLLYIGITGDLDVRFTQHSKDKPWWRSVTTVKIEHHDTPEAAAEAEVKAIRAERPLWNVAHTEKARQRRPNRVARVVDGETWVVMGEACRLLSVGPITVHRWADEGALRSRRLAGGGKIRGPRQIGLTSINDLLAEFAQEAVPAP